MQIYKDPCVIIEEGTRFTLNDSVYTVIEDIDSYSENILKLANYEVVTISELADEIVKFTDFDKCDPELVTFLESIVSLDGNASYWYAHYVLHDRFVEGENEIKKTPNLYNYIVNYCNHSPELMRKLSEGTPYYKKFTQKEMLMRYRSNCE